MKFIIEHLQNFIKNLPWNQTFPSLFIAISCSFLYEEMVHTLKFRILKSCFNTLPPVDSFFPHLQVLSFPFHNLFVTHFMNKNKFSPWYSLVLCLISGHKRANKHKSLIQNWYENKQAKNIIYVDIWKIIPYLQANQYRLKTNNIDSLIFISTIIKKLLMVFCFLDLVFLRKKRTGLVVYRCSSPQSHW